MYRCLHWSIYSNVMLSITGILCNAFVTRSPDDNPVAGKEHPPPLSPKQANQIWKTYYSFLGEKLHLSDVSAELFRTMPFVRRDKDHRLDAPFWRRAMLAFGTLFVAIWVLRQLLAMPMQKTFGGKDRSI